jgi:hypothetical protein
MYLHGVSSPLPFSSISPGKSGLKTRTRSHRVHRFAPCATRFFSPLPPAPDMLSAASSSPELSIALIEQLISSGRMDDEI